MGIAAMLFKNAGVAAASYDSIILGESSLVHYYKLNETSGTTATDSKGTNNATASGTASPNSTALLSDGSPSWSFGGGWLAFGSTLTPTSGAFSVECFAKRTSTNGGALGGLVASGTFASNGWLLYVSGIGNLRFYTQGGTDNDTGFAVALNTIYHFVVTYDGTLITVYANNSQKLQVTQGYSTATAAGFIGTWNSGANRQWFGNIAKVAIYNAALSTTQISAHYAAR